VNRRPIQIIRTSFQQWKYSKFLRIGATIATWRKWTFFHQITAFAAVGAVAGMLDYSVMVLLREAFSIDAVISALVGYAFGTAASYILNRLKTFRSARRHQEAVWRFATVNAVGFATTGIFMGIMVNAMHINYTISRVFTIIGISAMNFFAYKFWAFSPKPIGEKDSSNGSPSR